MAAKLRNVSFSEENNREFATYTPEVGGVPFNITFPYDRKALFIRKGA